MFRESSVRRIKDDVELMNAAAARSYRPSTELFHLALERPDIRHRQLDLRFFRHNALSLR
jgi:hypothetical protein